MNFSRSFITGGTYHQVVQNHFVKGGFDRLQEAAAPGAFHDSGERFDPPKCHPNTRVAVLKKLMDWILRQDPDTWDAFVMWLYGAAGAGKSALAQTLAERCHASNKLLASFFFSRGDPLRGNAKALIATLAYQLVLNLPLQVREHIVATIEHNPLIFTQSLETQFSSLIVSPLKQLAESGFFANPMAPRLIIIDGLDECDNPQVQRSIIHTIFQSIWSQSLPLLFLIASRPETVISSSFDAPPSKSILARLALDNDYQSFDDIRCFLNDKFEEIKKTHKIKDYIPRSWPAQDIVETLIRKSSGQFIYASTAVKFVSSSGHRPTDRLDIVLGICPANGEVPFAELDALYIKILSGVNDIINVLNILSLLILEPPDYWFEDNPESFLFLKPGDLSLILSDLGSLLSLEQKYGYLLPHILHASLKDFLLDASRSKGFYINPVERHNQYALLSFQHLENPSKGVYVPHRLFYHCSHAPITQELWEKICQLSVKSLMPVVSHWGIGLPDGMDRFFSFLASLEWDPDKRLYKEQLQFLDQYFMSHLDIYFSDPFLLLHLVTFSNQDIIFKSSLPTTSKRVDNGRLLLHLTSLLSPKWAKYHEIFSNFIEDPRRSGRYCLDGAKYASAAIVALTYTCNHWSHPIPKDLSNPDKHIRRNVPRRWREKFGRNSVLFKARMKCKPHDHDTKLYQYLHPYPYGTLEEDSTHGPSKIHCNVPKNPYRKHADARGIFHRALHTLPYLLERAEKSKEPFDIARQAQFGRRAKSYPKATRLAKKAIEEYLEYFLGDTRI